MKRRRRIPPRHPMIRGSIEHVRQVAYRHGLSLTSDGDTSSVNRAEAIAYLEALGYSASDLIAEAGIRGWTATIDFLPASAAFGEREPVATIRIHNPEAKAPGAQFRARFGLLIGAQSKAASLNAIAREIRADMQARGILEPVEPT